MSTLMSKTRFLKSKICKSLKTHLLKYIRHYQILTVSVHLMEFYYHEKKPCISSPTVPTKKFKQKFFSKVIASLESQSNRVRKNSQTNAKSQKIWQEHKTFISQSSQILHYTSQHISEQQWRR